MTSRKSYRWLKLSSLTLLSVLGCASSKTHDIGDDEVATLGLELSDYAAQWSGYAEAFTFRDYTAMQNNDAVALNIDAEGEGYLRVGNSPPMPVETDPDAYPRAISVGAGGGPNGFIDVSQVVSGKDYPLHEASVESRRLKLKVNPGDVYEDWCGLQPPVATGFEDIPYDCAPGNGGGFDSQTGECVASNNEQNFPISCGKFNGCVVNSLCSCTATECAANPLNGVVELDAALSEDGNTLEGTLLQGGERIVVRMTK